MDSIIALAKVYDSLSKGASTLDFPPSDITGDCAAQVQDIVRERKSGNMTEKAISSALSCMNNGRGLLYLGVISDCLGYWAYSVRAYEKALKILEILGDVEGATQTYNNLGNVYGKMGEWTKAIELYQKSLQGRAFSILHVTPAPCVCHRKCCGLGHDRIGAVHAFTEFIGEVAQKRVA